MGGLLSLYALTGDDLFKEKAVHVANKLLPAFDSPTGELERMGLKDADQITSMYSSFSCLPSSVDACVHKWLWKGATQRRMLTVLRYCYVISFRNSLCIGKHAHGYGEELWLGQRRFQHIVRAGHAAYGIRLPH